jgi:hypothetical protein
LKAWKGERICQDCVDREDRDRKATNLLTVVKELMLAKIDSTRRDSTLTEGVIELGTARQAFLTEFGGESAFGSRWARFVKDQDDRVRESNGKGATTLARMYIDASKFLEAAVERESRDFSKLTYEEMRAQHAAAVVEVMKQKAVEEAMRKIMALAEASAMSESTDLDELLVKFDTVVNMPPTNELMVMTP